MNFLTIPVNLRTPIVAVEIDNRRALSGLFGSEQPALIIGQRLAAGEAAAGEVKRVVSADDASAKFGYGSMLHGMIQAFMANNPFTEVYAVALDDDSGSVAATQTVTLGGSVTEPGVLAMLIDGEQVPVAVAGDDTPETIAAALAAAVNAETHLPVTASAASAVVTLTARQKGLNGNDIDVRCNYYDSDRLPSGLTVAIADGVAGAGNPDIDDALSALPDLQYDHVICAYNDSANMTKLETFLADRWGPLEPLEGTAYVSYRGGLAATSTYGNSRNSMQVVCAPCGASPMRPEIWAAVVGAKASYTAAVDPALPASTLPLRLVLPPAPADRWDQSERNILLYDGISTYTVDSGGVCRIERLVTMYQKNPQGVDDPSYLDWNTKVSLKWLREQVRTRMSVRFGRYKLADDTADVKAGQRVVRPKDIAAELVALYKEMANAAVVEDIEQFKANLVVERDAGDRGRVNAMMTPKLIGQLRVTAIQVQFIL